MLILDIVCLIYTCALCRYVLPIIAIVLSHVVTFTESVGERGREEGKEGLVAICFCAFHSQAANFALFDLLPFDWPCMRSH